MTAYNREIRAALETRLAGLGGLPSSISWENLKFEPTTDTSFLKTAFVPTSRRKMQVGGNQESRYEGLFVVSVMTPEHIGPGLGDDYAETILEGFEANSVVSYTNAEPKTIYVTCDYAERTNGLEESPWYRTQITIKWFSYS